VKGTGKYPSSEAGNIVLDLEEFKEKPASGIYRIWPQAFLVPYSGPSFVARFLTLAGAIFLQPNGDEGTVS
jgi:hypothetical protein